MKTITLFRNSYIWSDDCDMRGGTPMGETPWRLTREEADKDDDEFWKDIPEEDKSYTFPSYEKIEIPVDVIKEALSKCQ